MIYINHRINTIDQLEYIPMENGVELDIRYHKNDLVLQHDPFGHHEYNPDKFEDFLKKWNHKGPMILNIKTEGVELECIALMKKYRVRKWFFLDLSMPYFVVYAEKALRSEIPGFGPENLAVRFSEKEAIEYALGFEGKVKWVWVDCFTQLPLTDESYNRLKESGFKICLVSPELQSHVLSEIQTFKQQLSGKSIDAVCTKRPDLWGQNLSNQLIESLKNINR